jgi:hypothetical protein
MPWKPTGTPSPTPIRHRRWTRRKSSSSTGKISGSAGAVTDGDVASNGIYVLAQGAPFTVENIVSYNAPNGDGSFGNTISLSTFLEHVHTNGNYDIIVSDVNDALSTRVTATVTNGL